MKKWLTSADAHIKINGTMLVVWAILFIPSMLFWSESIMWLVFMSVYANFVGHFSAFMASMSEKKAEGK